MPIKSGRELLEEARQRVKEVSVREVQELRARGENPVFLDVREPQETNLGHLPGAVLIPRGVLESNVEARIPRDRTVVVYCASGNRSVFAAETLQQMGYENVASMAGGFKAWAYEVGEVEG